jgi:hypothetical protein
VINPPVVKQRQNVSGCQRNGLRNCFAEGFAPAASGRLNAEQGAVDRQAAQQPGDAHQITEPHLVHAALPLADEGIHVRSLQQTQGSRFGVELRGIEHHQVLTLLYGGGQAEAESPAVQETDPGRLRAFVTQIIEQVNSCTFVRQQRISDSQDERFWHDCTLRTDRRILETVSGCLERVCPCGCSTRWSGCLQSAAPGWRGRHLPRGVEQLRALLMQPSVPAW